MYDINKINTAVANFATELGIKHASNGDLDLYVVMRHYLNSPKIRKEINQLLRDNKSF